MTALVNFCYCDQILDINNLKKEKLILVIVSVHCFRPMARPRIKAEGQNGRRTTWRKGVGKNSSSPHGKQESGKEKVRGERTTGDST